MYIELKEMNENVHIQDNMKVHKPISNLLEADFKRGKGKIMIAKGIQKVPLCVYFSQTHCQKDLSIVN